MKDKKAVIINAVILAASLIFLFSCFYISRSRKIPSAEEIYTQNIHSVVELWAQTTDVGESYGTAVFLNEDGFLVTNAHVVTYGQLGTQQPFDHISIRFAAEDHFQEVALIKYDTALDLAVLQLSNSDSIWKPVTIGNHNTVKNGSTVYAIGNSLNHGISIAKGIVGVPLLKMAYNDTERTVIQCDLSITEGNSGGALLNENGELIGITTFRTKDSSGNVVHGLAYCIPIDIVMEFISAS